MKRSLIAILILALPCWAAAITLYPNPPTSWPVGQNPRGLALGDVDGDGDLDIVTADTDGNTYSLLLNDGTGAQFSVATFGAQSGEPRDVILAELNGQGEVDMALPCTGIGDGGSVLIYGNTGFGFALDQYIYGGGGPWHAVLGDFDGQAGLDLVVTQPWSFETITLRNDGAGYFDIVSSPVGEPGPGTITAADFDRDGDLDVAYTRADAPLYAFSYAYNDGSGGFTVIQKIDLPTLPKGIAAADFDGDDWPDLVIGQHRPSDPDNLRLYFGRPEGGFEPPVLIGDVPHAMTVIAADLDLDGDPDLLCSETYDYAVRILYNNGQGDFPLRETLTTGFGPYDVAVGDLDGDLVPDVAVSVSGEDLVQVFLSGGLTAAPPIPAARGRIAGVHPNPFNPTGRILVELAEPGLVLLDLHAVDGRRVRRLHAGVLPAGTSGFEWDGRDDAGRSLPGGVYLLALSGEGLADSAKLVLLK